jgi:hypothetical protein
MSLHVVKEQQVVEEEHRDLTVGELEHSLSEPELPKFPNSLTNELVATDEQTGESFFYVASLSRFSFNDAIPPGRIEGTVKITKYRVIHQGRLDLSFDDFRHPENWWSEGYEHQPTYSKEWSLTLPDGKMLVNDHGEFYSESFRELARSKLGIDLDSNLLDNLFGAVKWAQEIPSTSINGQLMELIPNAKQAYIDAGYQLD